MSYFNAYQIITITIASGQSLSDAIPLGRGARLQGIIMPSAWTTANLTFQVSDEENGTFVDSYDDLAAETSVSAAASRHLALYPDQFNGVSYLKVRSGTSATPVNQGAERTIKLIVEKQ